MTADIVTKARHTAESHHYTLPIVRETIATMTTAQLVALSLRLCPDLPMRDSIGGRI